LENEKTFGEKIEVEPTQDRLEEYISDDIAAAIEALLFAAPGPLSVSQLSRLAGCNKLLLAPYIDRLNLHYAETGRSFRIERYGESYRFYTLPEYDRYIGRLAEIPRPARLSRAALEVLSIIAYRQPVVKAEIERIRGIDSDGVIRTLLERGLVAIAGKSDGPGRPLLYKTTAEFLEFFGISELSQLPKPEADPGVSERARTISLIRPPENPRADDTNEIE
jgi:segregation and condensation protein B